MKSCKPPEFYYDQQLRGIPKNLDQLKLYIEFLDSELAVASASIDQVKLLGERGSYLRSLGDLVRAELDLKKALELISKKNLGVALEIQQKIRLANVFQWQRRFVESNTLFEEVVYGCRLDDKLAYYLDFSLQHSGKNFFDQHKFTKALAAFEEALKLRVARNAPADQIESTNFAIERTKLLLFHQS